MTSRQIVYLEGCCQVLHEAYERAAAKHGWSSQTPVPWSEVPEANKATMRDAVRELLEGLGGYEIKS